jgi:probable HAF family extracellular repeat protein
VGFDIRGGKIMHRNHVFLLGMLALAPGTALAVPAYTITNLGTLGGSFSFGNGINARGQVTGESFTAGNSSIHAFLWDPVAGMQDLGTLGGTLDGNYSRGYGINAIGQVTRRGFQHRPRHQR